MSADDKIMAAGFDHPCRETCSGWRQGRDRGRFDMKKFAAKQEAKALILNNEVNRLTDKLFHESQRLVKSDAKLTALFAALKQFPENDAVLYFWNAPGGLFNDPKADRHSFEEGARWMFNRLLKQWAEVTRDSSP